MKTNRIPQSRTRYDQIKQALLDRIRSGELGPGDKIMPERALQRKFNASYTTVSRALKELTEAGVIIRRWGKGTFIADLPPVTMNVAVTFDQTHRFEDPYLFPLADGISQEVTRLDGRTQVYPLPNAQIFGGGEQNLLATLLAERRLSGLISCSPHPPEDMTRLRKMGCPVVSILNLYPQCDISCLREDARCGAQQVVHHLVNELGHRRILLLMGAKPVHSARLVRASGVLCEALIEAGREHGLSLRDADIVYEAFDGPEAMAAVGDRLSGRERPTAVVCAGDMLAIQVIESARERGLRVPEDLSVVGWGDVLPGANLTTVNVPYEKMGRQSVELLNRLLEAEAPVEIVIPVKLVYGETTAKAC